MTPKQRQDIILDAIKASGTNGLTSNDIMELPWFCSNDYYEHVVREATKVLLNAGKIQNIMARGSSRQYRWYAAGIVPHTPRECRMCLKYFDSHHIGERVCPVCKRTDRWNNGGDAQGVDCGRRV